MALPAAVHSVTSEARSFPFVPRVHVYTERMSIDRGDWLRSELVDAVVPVLSLVFDYGGGSAFRSTLPLLALGEEGVDFDGAGDDGSGSAAAVRDPAAEAEAQRILETFGVTELSRLDDYVPGFASTADYVVHVDDNVHALCSFSAHAVPELRSRGFDVTIDPSYPYRVVSPSSPWYASLTEDDGGDWFSLELGIEVDGQHVNLLPALIEIIQAAPDDSTLEALTRFPARFRVVRVGEDRFLPVPPEQLSALLQVLIDLYDGCPTVDAEPRFRKERALCLAKLEDAVGPSRLRYQSGAGHAERARAFLGEVEPIHAEGASVVTATLRPYQIEGLCWLQHLRKNGVGGVLADDMGLGKTLQTIAHLALEVRSGRADRPSLVVMPTSLVGNWERELRKFAPGLRTFVLHGPQRHRAARPLSEYDVVLTTYPVLIRDVEAVRDTEFHLLVLDEAQAIKNPRSRAHQAVAALEARHRLCLSGTPIENNLDELWALFEVLAPGSLGSAEEFRARFRHPIERDGNELQLSLLRQRVAPFVLRRTKEQVAHDLPPKSVLVRPIEIHGEERELYESIRVAAHADVRGLIRKKGLAASTVAILDALMKLRQVCCHPRLVAVERARAIPESEKFRVLFEMLEGQLAQGRRVLVFSQFARMLALISEELFRRGKRHVMLTGSTRDRQGAIDAFQNGKVDLFLISLKAGGTGLNLTRADTVIHYEPWWNPAAQAQATDRAHRIGQTRPVFVHNLIVAGSVEERMERLKDRKRHLAESILATGGAGARWSEEDVEDLFAPLD